jgi:hypothetical protein
VLVVDPDRFVFDPPPVLLDVELPPLAPPVPVPLETRAGVDGDEAIDGDDEPAALVATTENV